MTLFTARLLGPVRHRRDWPTPRLSYLPASAYRSVISERRDERLT